MRFGRLPKELFPYNPVRHPLSSRRQEISRLRVSVSLGEERNIRSGSRQSVFSPYFHPLPRMAQNRIVRFLVFRGKAFPLLPARKARSISKRPAATMGAGHAGWPRLIFRFFPFVGLTRLSGGGLLLRVWDDGVRVRKFLLLCSWAIRHDVDSVSPDVAAVCCRPGGHLGKLMRQF